jgi:hypothetical protein
MARDAVKAAEEAGKFKDVREFDLISLKLENIRSDLMGGNPLTFLGGEPSSREIDEIYRRRHQKHAP